jgi:hypothetical protein
LINLGRDAGVVNRPHMQRYANNLAVEGLPSPSFLALKSYDDSKLSLPVDMAFSYTVNPGARVNLATSNTPWNEGALDINALGSGLQVQGTRQLDFTLSNLEKGKIEFAGMFLTSIEDDAQYSCKLDITDDNGTQTVIIGNTFDNSVSTATGKSKAVSYDCSVGGVLSVSASPGGTSTYGVISSICIDIAS